MNSSTWVAVGTAMKLASESSSAPTEDTVEGFLYLAGTIALICAVIHVWKRINKRR